MIHEKSGYILPVRFDDTPADGLPEDVRYERADENTLAALSVKIAENLGIRPLEGKASKVHSPRMTSPNGEVVFDRVGVSNKCFRFFLGKFDKCGCRVPQLALSD